MKQFKLFFILLGAPLCALACGEQHTPYEDFAVLALFCLPQLLPLALILLKAAKHQRLKWGALACAGIALA